jgi:hypothetical protein
LRSTRKLDQGERVAGRIGEQLTAHALGQARRMCLEQCLGVAARQRRHDELRYPGLVQPRGFTFANCRSQQDRLRLQPPREEGDHVGRGSVEPMRVLDHEEQRCPRCDLGQEIERGQGDEEGVRNGAVPEAEGGGEHLALGRRQERDVPPYRPQQLVQACELQARLRLDPGGPQDAQSRSGRGKHGEQVRFPDPRLTPEHDGASALADPVEKLVESAKLRVSTDERQHRPLRRLGLRPPPEVQRPA